MVQGGYVHYHPKSSIARSLQSGVDPDYEELRRWLRESDGDTDSLFDDSVGGCQDFDLMVSLSNSMDEYEQLIVDDTPTACPTALNVYAEVPSLKFERSRCSYATPPPAGTHAARPATMLAAVEAAEAREALRTGSRPPPAPSSS